MDRIEPIGPRPPQWHPVELEPDAEGRRERARREQERRRRQKGSDPSTLRGQTPSQSGTGHDEGDEPRHIDVRA